MAFEAGLERAGGVEFLCAGLDVAKPAIDGRQLGTQAEDGNINGFAAELPEAVLSGLDDAAGQAGALMNGSDGELAEITAIAAEFGVDTGEKPAGAILRDEDAAFLHHGRQPFIVRARTFEKGFDGEGRVDERDQMRPVGRGGQTEKDWGAGVSFLVHFRSKQVS